MKSEATFKTDLINRIESEIPGSMVFHLDPNVDGSGIPDLLVLCDDKWGALEGKKHKNAARRKHQEYYVEKMGSMGYSTFISPENEDAVMEELHIYFGR